MLRLYNTLTKKVEDFQPLNPPNVGFYSCGPTVYDFAHIGHARTYIFADILHRVLEFNGFKVKRVMNITDVGHLTSDSDTGEDKMEKGALREKKSVWEIAKFYTDDFMQMLQKLNIDKPEIICKATDHIAKMIELVKTLETKGFTYKIADGIYFDTSKFPEYGILTGQSFVKLQKSLKAGARVEVVSGKKNPTDFALWKFSYPKDRSFDSPSIGLRVNAQDGAEKRRQMEWGSPWRTGFPGWHIECSAMSMKYLGSGERSRTIDIHTGGVDHIPIHHTNEIAQSEAATGKQFVKYWLHADHLLVDGEKMSKSLGNFYRLSDIETKGFSSLALRYLFLTSSYRSQMNFTWKSLEASQTAYDSLCVQLSNNKEQITNSRRTVLSEEKLAKVNAFRQKFTEAINDDLNTAKGLAIVWEVIKSNIPPGDKYDLVMLFDEVLGLDLNQITDNRHRITIPDEIKKLVEKRVEARRKGLFSESDRLRQEINDKGYTVQDSPAGPIVVSNLAVKKLMEGY